MRILITGITGFVGGYLAETLRSQAGVEIHGLSRRSTWPSEWAHLQTVAHLHACDLTQADAIVKVIAEVQPDQIYHLAGYAQPGKSFQEPYAAWDANLKATLHLYDAVLAAKRMPRVLHVSSGLIYGDPETPSELLDERSQLRPATPYAASKAAADLAGYQYALAFGLPIVRVRPFNHIGPRQSPSYAVARFAQQLAAISLKKQPPLLETGDLSACRDVTDVRDMVRAYVLLLEKGRVGEAYNAGSGVAHSMQAILDRLLELAQVRVEVRQKLVEKRAADTAVSRADTAKLRLETGWSPHFSLEQSLRDILSYWRQIL